MSQLKQLLEKATQKNEMKWRVYAYDPAKDNKLVHTSELFDDINGAGIEKAEWLKKHPEHTIEIIAESADIDVKNPGVLEVPDGKKVDELPQSHFEKLVDKKGYAEVIRALTNLEVWNKDKNKSLSSWASNMADKLKKKFRPESAQKNEADTNAEKTLITKKQTIQRLAAKLTNDNLLPQLKQFKDYVDDVYNFALKNFDESAQINEDGTSWFVTLELRAPSSMNNKAVEDKLEKAIEQNGITVLDVTAERK